MNYYEAKLREHGNSVQALGWGSAESQLLRFKVLSEIADLRDQVVLDYGCGFGDLYDFLDDIHYAGYDNNPAMLAAARARYPTALFLDRPMNADYVLASGTFNLPTTNLQSELLRMWSLCRKGIAVNFTNAMAEHHTPGIVYRDPFETARYCSALTKKLTLRTDYKENDFCIYAYR